MADLDDGSIVDADVCLRRIHPSQVVEDKNSGGHRPSSAAFADPEMSVDVERILVENALDWKFSLKNYPAYSLAKFSAGVAREKALAVIHKPLAENPAHTEIHGNKTPGTRKHLVRQSAWVHLETPN